jgi:hypothetical protein
MPVPRGRSAGSGGAADGSRQSRDRSTRIVVTLVAVALVAYAGLLVLSREYTANHVVGSSYDSSSLGLKVFYRYLEELDYAPQRLERFDELPAPEGSTIVVSEPFLRAPTVRERQAMAQWVLAGGRLVLLGDVDAIAQDLGVMGATSSGQRRPMAPTFPSVYSQGVESIDLDGRRLHVTDPEWVTLFKDLGGQGMLVRTAGAGEVVWVPSAYPASNEGITQEDNAGLAVALAMARGGDVYFDEFHHGYVRGGGIWDRLGHGGRVALLLGLVALATLLLGPARRLGQPIPTPGIPEARTGAYTTQLAELYRRAGAQREALETLEDGLKRVIARRHGTLGAGLERYPDATAALEASAAVRSRPQIDVRTFTQAAEALGRARREVEGRDG